MTDNPLPLAEHSPLPWHSRGPGIYHADARADVHQIADFAYNDEWFPLSTEYIKEETDAWDLSQWERWHETVAIPRRNANIKLVVLAVNTHYPLRECCSLLGRLTEWAQAAILSLDDATTEDRELLRDCAEKLRAVKEAEKR